MSHTGNTHGWKYHHLGCDQQILYLVIDFFFTVIDKQAVSQSNLDQSGKDSHVTKVCWINAIPVIHKKLI